jgi:hypothetical protein
MERDVIDLKNERAKILRMLYDEYIKNANARLMHAELENKLCINKNIVQGCVKYLNEKNLVKVTPLSGGEGIVTITAKGVDVVEGPEAYSGQFSMNYNILSIHGNVNAPVVQTTSQSSANTSFVQKFDQISDMVQKKEEISKDEKEEILTSINDLKEMLKSDNIERGRLNTVLDKLKKHSWLIGHIKDIIISTFGLS